MKLKVSEVENGYVIETADTIKNDGVYIFRSVDVFRMLDFLGEVITNKKVETKEK